jgi:ribosomal protein L18E
MTKKDHTKAILKRIAASKQGILAAESYLAKMVREVEVAARAEKQTISTVVAEALKQLSKARADLEALEKLATSDD